MLLSCNSNKNKLFVLRESDDTGIDFANRLHSSQAFNMFKYMYFYNGAGCGAGDFNNDGKIDLFFASNQGQNKMYLNEGDLHFKDITAAAKIPNDGGLQRVTFGHGFPGVTMWLVCIVPQGSLWQLQKGEAPSA